MCNFTIVFSNLISGQSIDLHFDTEVTVKTYEEIIENCEAESDNQKAMKRIVELKRNHDDARKEAESKKLQSAISIMGDIVSECQTIVSRPVREVTKMENDLKKLILMHNYLFMISELWRKHTGWIFSVAPPYLSQKPLNRIG